MVALPHFDPIHAHVGEDDLTLVIDGPARLDLMIETIRAARTRLALFFYIFADDAAALAVREELQEAAARGVTVTLLVDGFGSEEASDESFAGLVAAGVRFARFIPRFGRRYFLRNHQKMLIADDQVALIGGSNIASVYFDDAPDGSSWHDLMLRVEGPAAARLGRYFSGLADWIAQDRPRMRGLVSLLARHSESSGAVRWVMGGPFRRLSPLTRALKRTVDAARAIDMIQAYFAPNWGFLRKLARVAERGRVRIITAARSDNVTTISAARHCYRRLLRGGATLYEYRPQMLHAKLIVADDVVWIGSANFDMRSLYLNAEIMLRIDDAGFAAAIRALVDDHLPWCDTITRDSHRRNSPFWARAIRLVSYFIVASVDFRLARRLNFRRRK